MRWPSSPGHGTVSSPGSSFWNFTHITLRPLVLVAGAEGVAGPQESAMRRIVPQLVRRQHGEFGIDLEGEARVRLAQRALDVSRGLGAREDEAEVTGALRQRHEDLIGLRRDSHIVDETLGGCRLDAGHPAVDAAARNR